MNHLLQSCLIHVQGQKSQKSVKISEIKTNLVVCPLFVLGSLLYKHQGRIWTFPVNKFRHSCFSL